ncbi:hypothetical protein E2320_022090, partial [Naja naja]
MTRMTGLSLLLLLLLFWLLPPTSPTSAVRMQTRYVLPKELKIQEYCYRPGDLIIGGNLPLGVYFNSASLDFKMNPFWFSIQFFVGFDSTWEGRRVYPSFIQIDPKESAQFVGLVQLLLYFKWNWVGLLATESESGEHFISTLMPMLKENEICLAFTHRMKDETEKHMVQLLLHSKMWLKVDIVVFFGDSGTVAAFQWGLYMYLLHKRGSFQNVWILTSSWKLSVMHHVDIWQSLKPLHGALQFRDHTNDISEFSNFLLSLDPLNPQGDMFLPL